MAPSSQIAILNTSVISLLLWKIKSVRMFTIQNQRFYSSKNRIGTQERSALSLHSLKNMKKYAMLFPKRRNEEVCHGTASGVR